MAYFNTAFVNGTDSGTATTQGIGFIAKSQISIVSSVPMQRDTNDWVVGIMIQGVSKVIHCASESDALALISALKAALI